MGRQHIHVSIMNCCEKVSVRGIKEEENLVAKTINVQKISEIVPNLLSMPSKVIWIDYDEEADVLYINFEKPQKATDSKMINDRVVHYRKDDVVRVTVLHASSYLKA